MPVLPEVPVPPFLPKALGEQPPDAHHHHLYQIIADDVKENYQM
jgi:hypothetical protein